MDDHTIEVLAKFTAELLSAVEQRARPKMPWPVWFAAMHEVDLNNPPLAASAQPSRWPE